MPYINGKYITDREAEQIMDKLSSEEREHFRSALKSDSRSSNSDDFLTSAIIGAVTGSSILGGLIGGSFLGGILGDTLEGTNDSFF